MQKLGSLWKSIPDIIRKPIVFVVGTLFIIAAGALGWLPGPGGIPLFLVGIAILATEFTWAERVKDYVMDRVKSAGRAIRHHPILSTVTLVIILSLVVVSIYLVIN